LRSRSRVYKSKIIPISSPNLYVFKEEKKRKKKRRRESLSRAQKVLPLFRNKLLPNRLVPKSGYIYVYAYIYSLTTYL
jgi:hypothetical protein